LKFKKRLLKFSGMLLFIVFVVSLMPNSPVFNAQASPASAYYFKYNVDREGFTNVEMNFNSTDPSGWSWVFVPRDASTWNYTVTRGQILQSEVIETGQVVTQNYYFYKAFRFQYRADGFFNMTLRSTHDTGAIVIEPRGIFYSPQIGFDPSSSGKAEVLFDPAFSVNSQKAIVVGSSANYPATRIQGSRVFFDLSENVVRLQVEFNISAQPQFVSLNSSDNTTFKFKTVARYQAYARGVLRLFDRLYSNLTRLFNLTLSHIDVQWFLPEFETLLDVGGFVPYTGEQLGEININIFYIRTVNGTVEFIAVHELVHHFVSKAGISPGGFLWFQEGMAQYLSVTLVSALGYEGATQEVDNLENGVTALIQSLGGENFGTIHLQDWSPSYKPPAVDLGVLYVASYYVVSRLPEIVQLEPQDYYGSFFKQMAQLPADFNGVKVRDINELALYLSKAANASVASTLKRWGFTVTDLYDSPVRELIEEAGNAIRETNPVFQPYRSLAEYFYQQALFSAERGDWDGAERSLQIAISIANLSPVLTFLTILGLLALIAFILYRISKRPKPVVPQPPPEILPPPPTTA